MGVGCFPRGIMCDEPEVDFVSVGRDIVVNDHAVTQLIAQLQTPMIHAGLNKMRRVSDHCLVPLPVGRARTAVGLQIVNADFTPGKTAADCQVVVGPGDCQSGYF